MCARCLEEPRDLRVGEPRWVAEAVHLIDQPLPPKPKEAAPAKAPAAKKPAAEAAAKPAPSPKPAAKPAARLVCPW